MVITNKQFEEYQHHLKNDWFLDWFEQIYGEHQTRILEKLAKKTGKSPYNCVNFETQIKYDRSEHNGDDWLPVKPEYQESWHD